MDNISLFSPDDIEDCVKRNETDIQSSGSKGGVHRKKKKQPQNDHWLCTGRDTVAVVCKDLQQSISSHKICLVREYFE